MFDDKDLGSKILGNPAITQYKFLTEIENRTNGQYSIADPNNGFCLLGEFGSSLHAQFVRQEDKRFNALYPKRAQTPEDLYPFLSDYAYVNLTASPADVKFQVLFNKNWIVDNAVRYDDIYDAHIIPKETIATAAGIPFTLYYPIMILVNRTTQIITVQYDINTPDKLKPMSTNLLYQVTERTINGITYLAIAFDMYQFTRQVYTETVDNDTGYYSTFDYDDKFYAAKVEWYNYSTDTWTELDYSLSQQNYDINHPTAILIFDNDSQQLSVRIPQVYFTTNAVSGRIRTTVLATKGEIDNTLSTSDLENITIDFRPQTSQWSAALARMKDGIVTTYNVTHMEGGANPIDFQTFRESVINQTIYDQVPISNLQISAAVSKYGFTLTKHLDNLADNRIFYAGATLTNPSDNSLIPVVASKLILKEPYDCATILEQADDTLTILPTTIFKYDRKGDSSRPLRDDEVYSLSQMTADDFVSTLNEDIYTRQPYHLWLNRNAQYPQAKAYNLMQPKMTSILLQRENIHSTVMMNVVSVNINHNNDGTGGYTFYIYVERSASLPKEDVTGCKLLLQTNSRSGSLLTFEATYSTTTSDGYDIYTFDLDTTYRLYSDDYLQISATQYDSSTVTTDLNLTSTWSAKALVSRSFTSNSTDDANLVENVPYYYQSTYLVVSQQQITVQLGESLESLIFNQVTTTWGDITYEKYDSNIPYTYDKDVYLTDRKGYMLTKTVTGSDGKPTLSSVKLFNKGDEVLSGQETSYTLTAPAASGTKSLSLNTSEGILIGQVISGTNIRDATLVESINGNTITITNPVMNDLTSGSTIIAASTYIDTVTTQATAKGGNTLTIGNSTNIVNGMAVVGFNIPTGTTVTNSADGVITLSNNVTDNIDTGDTIAIYYGGGSKTYKHRKGDVILDGKGNPVSSGTRSNVYSIMLIQFDARLYESQDPNDISFVQSLPSLLSDKSHSLDPIRDQLIEQTYLYYLPFRTLGDATYGIGDGKQITMPLEMSYDIVYYVSEATKSDTTVQSVIVSSTLNAINAYVQKGKISTNELGYDLKNLFSSLVTAIDISGIDETTTKTATIDTQGASPSIEKKLVINAAGQKVLQPNVNITFQVSPT